MGPQFPPRAPSPTHAAARAASCSRRPAPAASTLARRRSSARQPDARLTRTTNESLAAQSAKDLDRPCSIRPLPRARGGRYLKYRPPPDVVPTTVHPRVFARTPRPPHAASLEAVSSTYSSFPAAPLLASSFPAAPPRSPRVGEKAARIPASAARRRTPWRWATRSRREHGVRTPPRAWCLLCWCWTNTIDHSTMAGASSTDQTSSTVPRPRAGAPLRAGRFQFGYRDAPARTNYRTLLLAITGAPPRARRSLHRASEPPTEKQETELARTYKNPWPRPTASSVSVCLEVEMI